MKKKRHLFDIQLNSITDTDNPTKKEVEFIIHDFEVSHNWAFISKETAEKSFETLENTPIVCKYYPITNPEAKDDGLGSHEMYIDTSREDGSEIVAMDTVPIGVFTEPAYIKTIEVNGEEKEVVAGKGVLWASRFPNVIGLLKEWIDNGITVSSSMEILYDSYKVEDGITEILSFVYEGHCILQSVDTERHSKVYPAYDVSKLTKLVAQAINQDKQGNIEEGEGMFKKVYELSHEDIRTKLYEQLDPTLGENTYSWIADVYDSYFIANIYSFEEGNEFNKYFKFNYTKTEETVTIDFDSKVEVFLKRNWEEVVPEEVQQQLNKKEEKIKELESQINSVKEEKQSVEKQFNESIEKLTELNSLVEALKPIKEKYEKEQFEKALSEKKEYYSAKFSALNAEEKFKSDEVQELIKKAVSEDEEGQKAILQLNTMLVDLVTVNTKQVDVVREVSSKRENLLPESSDFESRYGL